MFSRLEQTVSPIFLPDSWSKEVKQALLSTYGDKCLSDDKTFEVYGLTYPNEAILIVSYVGLDPEVIPVTLFASCDLQTQNSSEEILDKLIDATGLFFDDYFAHNHDEEEWDEMNIDWQEAEYRGLAFHYRVSRENIALTLEAEKLLTEQ